MLFLSAISRSPRVNLNWATCLAKRELGCDHAQHPRPRGGKKPYHFEGSNKPGTPAPSRSQHPRTGARVENWRARSRAEAAHTRGAPGEMLGFALRPDS